MHIWLTADMYDEQNGLKFSRLRTKEIEEALGVMISDDELRKAISTE